MRLRTFSFIIFVLIGALLCAGAGCTGHGSQIAAEIAEARTMLSFRPELKTEKLFFRTEQAEIRNVKIAALRNQDLGGR